MLALTSMAVAKERTLRWMISSTAVMKSASVAHAIGALPPATRPAAPSRRGCRVNPARPVAAVEISNDPAVLALGVAAERDSGDQLDVAVGDIHTAESFPDSLRRKEQRTGLRRRRHSGC